MLQISEEKLGALGEADLLNSNVKYDLFVRYLSQANWANALLWPSAFFIKSSVQIPSQNSHPVISSRFPFDYVTPYSAVQLCCEVATSP